MREAPSLVIVPALQAIGARIRAYDPAVRAEAAKLLPGITFCADAYATLAGANSVVILTEWNEFRARELHRVKSLMRRPLMLATRAGAEPRGRTPAPPGHAGY